MKLENKNFLYNLIYQILIYLIPLVLTPYISRVLGVNNLGIYSYTYSIVYYFMLAAMLGINNHASRKIAGYSNNREKVNEVFCSIYYFQLIAFALAFIAYIIFLLFFKYEYKNILAIQTLFLISTCFDINWLFFGLEKFKITVSRNAVIKLLSMILIFIFVKNRDDLRLYTLIMSGSTLLSQLYLWLFVKKEIKFIKIPIKEILTNLRPCLILFIPVISYSIYRITDKTMIGAIANTIELGNYDSAEKIINIPISFLTALSTVMLPHMSKFDEEEIKKNIYASFKLSFFIICPMFICLEIIAPSFSILFFGKEFSEVPNLIRILLFTTLFASVANVVRTNYLIPTGKDNIYVLSTIYGAVINLILNIIFIKKYGSYGACIGTLAAEGLLMIYQSYHSGKAIDFKYVFKLFLLAMLKSIPAGIVVLLAEIFMPDSLIKLIIEIASAVSIYFITNYKYIIYDFFGKKNKTVNL